MDLRAAYLLWLNIPIEPKEDLSPLVPEEPIDDGEAEYHQEARIADTILAELKAESTPSFSYKLQKNCLFRVHLFLT